MSRSALIGSFALAAEHLNTGAGYLQRLREIYLRSNEPDRLSRVAALDAKIDALRAVQLEPNAVPWADDWRGGNTEPPR